jgi:hypothetical protein
MTRKLNSEIVRPVEILPVADLNPWLAMSVRITAEAVGQSTRQEDTGKLTTCLDRMKFKGSIFILVLPPV